VTSRTTRGVIASAMGALLMVINAGRHPAAVQRPRPARPDAREIHPALAVASTGPGYREGEAAGLIPSSR
jgi:hypothetical protein